MKVRLRFDPPGWFAADAKVLVRFDGRIEDEGSFMQGFVVDLDVEPGMHVLETEISALGKRRRRFELEVPDGDDMLEVKLTYSRMWGNFDKKPALRRVDANEPLPVEREDEIRLEKVRATWVILAAIAVCFAAELALDPGDDFGSPSIETLVALGGLFPPSVADGEWFRFMSCTFLHADFVHLGFNALALVLAGFVVEGLVGWRWFLAVYFTGGIGGSLMSLALNPGNLVSVGASGAIMGLFAAGLFVAHTLPRGRRGPVQLQMLRAIVPSLLPFAFRSLQRVDVGAHLGGAIAGAIVGAVLLFFLMRVKANESALAEFRKKTVGLALAVSLSAAAAISIGAVALVAYPSAQAHVGALLPNEQLTESDPPAEVIAQWVARYPDDPRVRLYAGDREFADERFDLVLEHVRRGRAGLERHRGTFSEEGRRVIAESFDTLARDAALRSELVPNREWLPVTSTPNALYAHLDAWLVRFPNDPRLHVEASWRAFDRADFVTMERHARIAREHFPRFVEVLPHLTVADSELLLGTALLGLERADEARDLVVPYCAAELAEHLRRLTATACPALMAGSP
jgi:membrane associated rhomboid family serine protease